MAIETVPFGASQHCTAETGASAAADSFLTLHISSNDRRQGSSCTSARADSWAASSGLPQLFKSPSVGRSAARATVSLRGTGESGVTGRSVRRAVAAGGGTTWIEP